MRCLHPNFFPPHIFIPLAGVDIKLLTFGWGQMRGPRCSDAAFPAVLGAAKELDSSRVYQEPKKEAEEGIGSGFVESGRGMVNP